MTMHTADGSGDPYQAQAQGAPYPPQGDPYHPDGARPQHDPYRQQGVPSYPPQGQPYPGQDQPTMQLGRIPAQAFEQFGPPPLPPRPVERPVPPPRAGEEPAAPKPAAGKPASSTGRNGLIMAMGSLASRALGFVRSAVIVAALATGPAGDAFSVANSLPNIVYMMLLGGVLASVFVPELVHAMQTHKDGGQAYSDRLLTLCGVILVVLTVGAWLFAPQIVDFYSGFDDPVQRELAITFARYCLPQILFYGVFTLLGQVLNARDRFGAMMWTPVLNNVVAIAVFGGYLAMGRHAYEANEVSSGDAMLLGLGSTLGIVVQAAALLPSLRSARFTYRPRFDWRGAGLTRPLRAAGWALALVVATQLSFAVITSLSTSAGTAAKDAGVLGGRGFTAYNNAYALFVVPQGVITVSLVTALLPGMARAATAGDYRKIGEDLAGVLRSSAAMVVTAAVLFFALGSQISMAAYGYGSGAHVHDDAMVVGLLLMAFAVGLPAFCAQYGLARGFYAMGDARTPFWLTLISTGTNAALCWVAYETLPLRYKVVGMAVAHTVAATLSAVVTGVALGRRLAKGAPPAAVPAPRRAGGGPDETMVLRTDAFAPGANATVDLGVRRRGSGLEGGRLVVLHLGLVVACVPGALAAHWLAGRFGAGLFGSLTGLAAGSLAVLVSLFVLARPLGVGASVAPFARKLRIPYPAPAPTSGKHRR
ncbi:murein biosynthesis integral membrane protein MurJ [Kitasatospora cineracea]|uniref:Putative peptidoglycan lipid II flippase n=1 Tax=Kitasatospora cineracea TaxID=88074 RepID=A0A8G1UEJ4_9ACTN|nr:murein biosynthesis integral membrane protein MurJ [Kitasatospora cineracea]ROR42508.1 putative peptidoglycan lipid II flippase [Kitasatospora cineracea]